MTTDGISTGASETGACHLIELFHGSRPQKASTPTPPTFIIRIDEEDAEASPDARLTLRALRADVTEKLQFTGLMCRLDSNSKPGRIVCAIVAASQFLRQRDGATPDRALLKLIDDHCRFIIIDDRQIYLPKDKPTIDANELTKLEAKGYLITAPALREDAATGIKRSNLIKDIKIHYLLHQIFDQLQPTHP